MKLLIHIMIFTSMLTVLACSGPQRTSSARAAYDNAVSEFKANKKKNQKRKKQAGKEAKRKKTRNNRSYFHGRPY